MTDDKEPTIALSVREWLARIDSKLDTKADKAEVQAVINQYGDLSGRVRTLEDNRLTETIRQETHTQHEETQSERSAANRDTIKTNVSLLGSLIAVIGIVFEFVHSFFMNTPHT